MGVVAVVLRHTPAHRTAKRTCVPCQAGYRFRSTTATTAIARPDPFHHTVTCEENGCCGEPQHSTHLPPNDE